MIQKRKVKINYIQKNVDYKTLSEVLAAMYNSGGKNEKSNSIK